MDSLLKEFTLFFFLPLMSFSIMPSILLILLSLTWNFVFAPETGCSQKYHSLFRRVWGYVLHRSHVKYRPVLVYLFDFLVWWFQPFWHRQNNFPTKVTHEFICSLTVYSRIKNYLISFRKVSVYSVIDGFQNGFSCNDFFLYK